MPICKFCGEEFELSDARRRIGRSYGAGIYNEYYPNGDVCESYVNGNYDVISLSISNCREGCYELVKEECRRINQYKISTKNNCYLPGRQFGLNLQEDEAKAAYRQYINNCIFLIEKRTESMLKKLSV
ncbi:hypothetical protein [Sellimonas catena]|uniref:Uncharacterized protein n=1 Tax=Sellimonas catena TaxID=2994035 RepID=A0A9W6FIE0_9FIRM|nr:hypothetical protein [Sellimonas catena]GLG90758.1 hypothetical protein Selli2_21850 [Sellimonas catena]